jgi:hypothetical protein
MLRAAATLNFLLSPDQTLAGPDTAPQFAAVSYITGAPAGGLILSGEGCCETDRRAVADGATGEHEIMRSMAVDYRRAAEDATDPERRDRLVGLTEYCQEMAVAMERCGAPRPRHAGANRPGKPAG